MRQKSKERIGEAHAEVSTTLHLIEFSGNEAAAQEAVMKLMQLSDELREKYALVALPEDEQATRFYTHAHEKVFSGISKLSPRIWCHFEDHHFQMIRDVGEVTAHHIRCLLKKSGIAHEPDATRGILKAPLRVIKTYPAHVRCPAVLEDVTLGDLHVFVPEKILEHYDVIERDQRFVDQMYRQLKKV